MESSAVGWIVSDVGRGLSRGSAALETATTTYGLTSAPCWMKIADEVGPSGIVASSVQKQQRSCNPPCFSPMPSEETNVRSPHPRSSPAHKSHRNASSRSSSSVAYAALCTAQNTADSHTDRVALRLDSHDHILWLHQELAAAHVHQVRLSLSSGTALTLQIDS